MHQKLGLVLSGGGSRGSYEVGALRALRTLNFKFDVVAGTSIGALVGCMVVQGDYEQLDELWSNIQVSDVMQGDAIESIADENFLNNANMVISFFKQYASQSHVDITPFKKMIHRLYNNEKFLNSPIDYYAMTVAYPSLRPVVITKKMMKEKGEDYLLASASCFPVFPMQQIKKKKYIDGGYYDNLPVSLVLKHGVDHAIIIDVHENVEHSQFLNKETIDYIYPKVPLGNFMSFDRKLLDRNMELGFNDVYKFYGKYRGYRYTFKKYQDPKYFKKIVPFILNLEAKYAKDLNFKGATHISDTMMQTQKVPVFTKDVAVNYLLDELLEMLECPVEKVYTYKGAKRIILTEFEDAFCEDYDILPNFTVKKIKAFFQDLNRIGILSRMIAQILFSKKRIINDNLLYLVNPMDIVVAHFIVDMYNEEKKK